MKVLHVNNAYHPYLIGGAEVSVQLLVESTIELGHDTAVITLTPEEQAYNATVNGIHVHYIPMPNLFWPWDGLNRSKLAKLSWHIRDIYNSSIIQSVHEIIKQEKPDIVHTHNIAGLSASIWNLIKSLNIAVIHTIRDYYLLCYRSTMFRKDAPCKSQCTECILFSHVRKRLSCIPDAVVGISRYILEIHKKYGYFPDTKLITNIGNPILPNKCYTTGRKYSEEGLRIGYLGRLRKEKGIELFLEVVSSLELNDMKILIAGTGTNEYEQFLRRRYENPQIEFLGYVPSDLFLANIDLLVVPSIWNEPFGRIIIEAYSYGVPVIGANRGAIPELIEMGRTGYIFDPDIPESMLKGIEEIRQSPKIYHRMSHDAVMESQQYHPTRIVESYLSVYEKVIAFKKRSE